MKWLLALTLIALGASMYASILQRRALASWSGSAVFVLVATIEWLAGVPHWAVYMSYSVGAVQAGTALFQQLRQRE